LIDRLVFVKPDVIRYGVRIKGFNPGHFVPCEITESILMVHTKPIK